MHPDRSIFFIVVLTLSLASGLIPLWHTDIWGHARYGQWIIEQGTFPSREPLSPYSDPSLEFINHATIPSCSYAGAYQLASHLGSDDPERRLIWGANALRLIHLLIIATSTVLIWQIAYRVSQSGVFALLLVGALVYFLYPFALVQRPQWGAVPLFLLVGRATLEEKPHFGMWFSLPIVFLIWANTHATWVFGLALLATKAYPLSIRANGWAGLWPQWENAPWAGLLVVCTLATCVNPHGPLILPKILAFGSRSGVSSMTEWEPLGSNFSEWVTVILPMFLLAVRMILSQQVPRGSLLLLLIVLCVGTCFQKRLFLWYILLWTLCLCESTRKAEGGSQPSFRSIAAWATLVSLVLWAIVASIRLQPEQTLFAGTPYRIALELQNPDCQGKWIPQLPQILEENYPNGQYLGAIFTSETQGDFLFWSLAPKFPITLTTHAHLFQQQHWETCLAVRDGADNSETVLKQLHVNLIVIESFHEGLIRKIASDPNWIVLIHEPVRGTDRQAYRSLFVAIRKTPVGI